jgi:hypothetical protein
MQAPTGRGERFFRSMGWFLPLFSFGMLLLLTGSKAEVKKTTDSEAAIICTCPAKAASEPTVEKLPNVSLTDSAKHEATSANEYK